MTPFAIATFLGAFLLFLIQPMTGRFVLPWFGGSAGIWTVCLLFFQTALFLGYSYAHLLNRLLPIKRQVAIHAGLVLGALLWLPPIPEAPAIAAAAAQPIGSLLSILINSIGPLFVVLSATSPLVQSWFFAAEKSRSPYRLYVLSNLGSLAALLGYPILIEPAFNRSTQAYIWAGGFIIFIAVTIWCALHLVRKVSDAEHDTPSTEVPVESVRWSDRLSWIGWAAIGTGLLAATTARLSADVPPVPFLWIVPITLYLLSFVVTFTTRSWYRPKLLAGLMMLMVAVALDLQTFGTQMKFGQFLVSHLVAVMVAFVICHGELYKSRPAPERLTDYYLTLAGGGALGTLWAAVVSPTLMDVDVDLALFWSALICGVAANVFRRRDLAAVLALWSGQLIALIVTPALRPADEASRWDNVIGVVSTEWITVSMAVTAVVALAIYFRQRHTTPWRPTVTLAVWALPIITAGFYVKSSLNTPPGTVANYRSFYGRINVVDYKFDDARANHRIMAHGTTNHGLQLTHPDYRHTPTSYYTQKSGVGRAFIRENQSYGRNIGVVGLGVGTLATYGMTGDTMRFYEIDPEVIAAAEEHFDFMQNSAADIEVALGDGRLLLEYEARTASHPPLDILVVDAFSGDSVPIHLITTEAFDAYLNRLAPDGVLVINISNRILDLRRAIEGTAREHDLYLAHIIDHPEQNESWHFGSEWLLLSRDRAALDSTVITKWTGIASPTDLRGPLLSDEFASLLPLLR